MDDLCGPEARRVIERDRMINIKSTLSENRWEVEAIRP